MFRLFPSRFKKLRAKVKQYEVQVVSSRFGDYDDKKHSVVARNHHEAVRRLNKRGVFAIVKLINEHDASYKVHETGKPTDYRHTKFFI